MIDRAISVRHPLRIAMSYVVRLVLASLAAIQSFSGSRRAWLSVLTAPILMLCASSALAADFTFSVTAPQSTLRRGDTALITYKISNNSSGMKEINFSEVLSFSMGGVVANLINSTCGFNQDVNNSDIFDSGLRFTVNFTSGIKTISSGSACTIVFSITAHAYSPLGTTTTTFTGAGPSSYTTEPLSLTIVGAAPTISSISPSSGSTAGNYQVTIDGENFVAGQTTVAFDGVAGTGVTVLNPGQLNVTVPAGAAGTADVVVTSEGVASAPAGFTYLGTGILSVSDGDLIATGPYGGPFSPSAINWTLGNTGDADISVSIDPNFASVFEATPITIVIRPGDQYTFAAIVNTSAQMAAPGAYDGVVTFTDNTNNHSTTRDVRLTITKADTTTALTISPNPSTYPQSVTLTAQVNGGASPTGTVTFRYAGNILPRPLDAAGVAKLELLFVPPGDYSFTAEYSGDANHYPSTSSVVALTSIPIATTLTLSSSVNPSNAGAAVMFTAAVTPASMGGGAPGGAVTFAIDGVDQPAVALAAGGATFATSLLGAGDHQVTARYGGDASHAASAAPPLVQTVRALGSVVLRIEAAGAADRMFDFASSTPGLNLSVASSGGTGESAPVALAAGAYTVTIADMRAQGLALATIACSDADSSGEAASRSAVIRLDAGEAVVCTFTLLDSARHTAAMIGQFLERRGNLLLANQPDIQRRIDRLNGAMPAGLDNPVSALMGLLPSLAEGGALSVSTSLGAVRRLAGDVEPARFDAWLEGSYTRFEARDPEGASQTLGGFGRVALGADWLVDRNLLIGGFVQMDHLAQKEAGGGPGEVSGTGWLAGPYLTARLSEHLFLDVLAAAGTSSNSIDPFGLYEDDFSTTRFLASASLQGQWMSGGWTFSPRARLGWFHERSGAYTDSLGVAIPSVSASIGQFAAGPGVSYAFPTERGAVIETGLRLDAVADFIELSTSGRRTDLSASIEACLGLTLPGGARLSFSATHAGIGSGTNSATTGKASIAIPLN